ncbi:hypothetical protein [Prosthecomicrobium sp. N25]|uniref:hypothetical protein n=1 Tax=Prosthecomicrobium sp. N25 TaxID=3129254 RepID=UPI0030774801
MWIRGALVAVGCVVGGFGLYRSLTVAVAAFERIGPSSAYRAADEVVARLGRGDRAGVHADGSEPFRRAVGLADFERYATVYELDQVTAARYDGWKVSTDIAQGTTTRVSGRLERRDGTRQPVEFTFVGDGPRWRLHHLRLWTDVGETKPLAEAEVAPVVRRLNALHAEAIASGRYRPVYEAGARLLKLKAQPEDLERALGPLTRSRLDFRPADDTLSFRQPPALDSEGVLVAEGSYATRSGRVAFRYRLLNEDGAYKPIGFDLKQVQPAPQS